jgi:MoaA/NifB/PqqE/SkfB family radical SAM enzyme
MPSNTNIKTIKVGFSKNWILLRMWVSIGMHFSKRYKNPFLLGKIRKHILSLKQVYTTETGIQKLALVDGKYYFNSNMNGWPSPLFFRPLEVEVSKGFKESISNIENLKLVQIALTKKCPLNCEHCYEGHELNKKDTLSLEDHKLILQKLHAAGISVIQYGGGEPMTRVEELVQLFESSPGKSDFYIYTSGFNCSRKNLEHLKQAGLTGISIGLDHYLAAQHNAFRRNDKAFQWAIDAAKNARELNLVLTFTLCATKEFCSEENLWNYLNFAKEHGAQFVQVLEPRAAGNYEYKDVYLGQDQLKTLETFFLKANADASKKYLPIVLYTGYHQRKKGCLGAGNGYLYIDTDGYMSSCPFCRNMKTHILDSNHETAIHELKMDGCDLPI